MDNLHKLRISSIISDPDAYINEIFQLHPDAKHDEESGAIEIKNPVIDSVFKYMIIEEGLFLFYFKSFSPIDAEYEFLPNPHSGYYTLVFYFTEKRSKNPIYLNVDGKYHSSDQLSMFFNGRLNAEVFIKANQKAYGIRFEIHKNWFHKNLDTTFLSQKSTLADILNFKTHYFIKVDSEEYKILIDQIEEEFKNSSTIFPKIKLKYLSYQIIHKYITANFLGTQHNYSFKENGAGGLKMALNYLEKNIYKDFPGNILLAELCHLSESTFSKKFKTTFKISPTQHFRNLKMKEALRLLELGQNVKDVSIKIGYKDPSAFGRIFKQMFGKSPASYVKQ